MRTRSWSKRRTAALLLAALPCQAMAQDGGTPPVMPIAQAEPVEPAESVEPIDPLFDALTCRSSASDIAALLPRLRAERPRDFVQAERQYSEPMVDLYRLESPVQAWGHESDAIVITRDRVLMIVDGPLDDAARRLESSLAQSDAAPLPGALDDLHALVVYAGDRPGMEQRVLIGCEYRLPGLSLLDDPADAWRKPAITTPHSP